MDLARRECYSGKNLDTIRLNLSPPMNSKIAAKAKAAAAKAKAKAKAAIAKEKKKLETRNSKGQQTLTQMSKPGGVLNRNKKNSKEDDDKSDDDEDMLDDDDDKSDDESQETVRTTDEYDIPACDGLPTTEIQETNLDVSKECIVSFSNLRKGTGWNLELLINLNTGARHWVFLASVWKEVSVKVEMFMKSFGLNFQICGYRKKPLKRTENYKVMDDFKTHPTVNWEEVTKSIHTKLKSVYDRSIQTVFVCVKEFYFVNEDISIKDNTKINNVTASITAVSADKPSTRAKNNVNVPTSIDAVSAVKPSTRAKRNNVPASIEVVTTAVSAKTTVRKFQRLIDMESSEPEDEVVSASVPAKTSVRKFQRLEDMESSEPEDVIDNSGLQYDTNDNGSDKDNNNDNGSDEDGNNDNDSDEDGNNDDESVLISRGIKTYYNLAGDEVEQDRCKYYDDNGGEMKDPSPYKMGKIKVRYFNDDNISCDVNGNVFTDNSHSSDTEGDDADAEGSDESEDDASVEDVNKVSDDDGVVDKADDDGVANGKTNNKVDQVDDNMIDNVDGISINNNNDDKGNDTNNNDDEKSVQPTQTTPETLDESQQYMLTVLKQMSMTAAAPQTKDKQQH